jgi:amino acid adenylation domain-containing protein
MNGHSLGDLDRSQLEQSITDRFEEQVEKDPGHVAIRTRTHSLTYEQLNRGANVIARQILSRRGREQEPVALLLENDAPMIEAILGVLKAGKIYVPLDPSLPSARLSHIVHDSESCLLITNTRNSPHAASLAESRIPVIDVNELDRQSGADNPGPLASADSLSWIIYTSGSTGQPKGVVQTHRNILHYVHNYTNGLSLSAADRLSLLFSFGVNGAAHEMFSGLLNGASLHPFDIKAQGFDGLANWLLTERATTYASVPTVFRHFCERLTGREEFGDLRFIKLIGETVSKREVELFQQLFPPTCRLINRLGSTETGTIRWYFIDKDTRIDGTSVPVGYAVSDNEVMLVDDNRMPVPIGDVGEIAVKSRYLSPGYWRKPEHTSRAFIEDGHGGERIYLTGDLGRMLPDSCLLHMGRKDFQVKIRGHRVETGEIEAAVLSLTDAKEVIVMARDDARGEPRLVAYLLMAGRPRPSPVTLRRALAARLPAYMMPSAFVMLESFPTAPNGKVNRGALPQPDSSRPELETPFATPSNDLEQKVAQVWSDILGVYPVGIHDNFFDLGGHSLAAARIVSRIGDTLELEVNLTALFEAPTVASLAKTLARLATNKGVAPPLQPVLIPRRKAEDPVPLSSTQEQMWFIDQLAPGSASYNTVSSFQLRGPLNVIALERSFNEIVRRHESLRTTFDSVEGVPVQVVTPSLTITLPVVAVSAESGSGTRDEAMRVANEHARQPFDLAKGPLLRCTLFKVADQEHVLLIAVHHIVNDGWSWSVLFRELSALYDAFAEERPATLPQLPLQYGDFARWEREHLRNDLLDQRLAYWTRQLAHAPTLLDLPTDRRRTAVQSFRGTVHSEMFPLELKEQLEALSREEGATLFMTLCAAFNALLFRWSGQEDIVLGSTIARRNRPELESLIGLLINTLVLRTDLSGNPTFRELLHRFREVALDAYANHEVPFDKVIEKLHSKRSLSHGTLFQVLFVLHQGTSQQELSLAGLTVERVPVEMGAVKFDLSVSMVDKPDGLDCGIAYQTDLFDAATIRRFAAQFQRLLHGVVRDPNLRLSQLPLMSEAERRQMLVTWNDTKKDYPTDQCIHELFEQQVSRTPDACAVELENATLSYRQLDSKAATVADRLREAGVRPGDSIVICIDRSVDMLVGLIAVLKAGCAYVPLDSQYSLERLPWVLEDTGAPVLLTGRRLAHVVSNVREQLAALTVIFLDDPAVASRQPVAQPSTVHVSPDDLAYVIYTSGSTGTPKGVEITHRSLVNFALASVEAMALQPADRVLQFASLSFDTAAEEIFSCLITGAALVLRTDRMLDSASAFLNQCRRWRITVLDLPTVYWHELTENIATDNLELPATLRLVVLGGDKALPERAAQWQRASNGRVRLLNEYGPTEATVVATTHEVGVAGLVTESREVPIGRPIANVQTYILDRELNPVPVGARGELYIGGAGLARGYRRRPDLTAESFIPSPFSEAPGERLYRTGDLARYLADGSIEFLGRTDHQVKVRGFRVEPGEIEAVLTEHPAVRHVVVVPVPDHTGDHRLIAYVVPTSGVQLNAQILRDFLKGRLPQYTIPAAFVFLNALPLTPHGKVDRRALPEPDPDRFESHDAFIAARTPLERELVQEWETLLATRPIGIRDNFFELGGHSLLAVRLTARIEKRLGRATSVAALFESPTIEQLAVRLERHTGSESWSSLMAVQPNGSRPPFFWVHGDHSIAILPTYLGPDQPLYGLEHQSQDGQPARYTRVEDIAAHYLREVRSEYPHGPYLLGGYSFGAVVAFEMAHQLRRAGEQVDVLFLLDPPGKVMVDNPVPVTNEVRRHLRQVASQNASDTTRYLWLRIQTRLYQHIGSQVMRRINTLRVKLCLSMHRALPPSLRSRYILGVYAQALREYVPQRYSGPVTLIKANDAPYKPRLDWAKLTTTEPRILQLNGGHMDLRIEPQVGAWAESLKQVLNRRHTAGTTTFDRVSPEALAVGRQENRR